MSESTIPSGGPQRSDGRVSYLPLGVDDKGNPVALFVGAATDDATIVADIGEDVHWADGSIYISAVDGSGALFQKVNDTWTANS